MKLPLSIADRVSIQQCMPDRDSFENLCLRQSIMDKTSFTPDEIESNKINTITIDNKDRLTWIETKDREFDFNSAEVVYIQSNLKRLSESKDLTSIAISLYKKIHSI